MRHLTRRRALTSGAGLALGGLVGGRGRRERRGGAAQAGSPAAAIGGALGGGGWEVVDLSVTTGRGVPGRLPRPAAVQGRPAHLVPAPPRPDAARPQRRRRKDIAAVNAYQITEHTGTQIDFPPHFIPPPGVNIPGARGAPRAATPATSSR